MLTRFVSLALGALLLATPAAAQGAKPHRYIFTV